MSPPDTLRCTQKLQPLLPQGDAPGIAWRKPLIPVLIFTYGKKED